MNPNFDDFDCPSCILQTIVSEDAQLRRFVETTDPERLERWFDSVEESNDENILHTLLWLIMPIVRHSLECQTSERVRRWFEEPRVRNLFEKPMSMEKTRRFANVLANAVDSIPVATQQRELQLKLLEQLLPINLRTDLLLRRCHPCNHSYMEIDS
ncbi:hypothetical protein FRC14_006185 [Serendipita sp. 396]|nr:hypothetical protein FRC14_006185 [Serendipita sp. 396]KAG8778883.1 hypothetical protein FRC15_010498 [Serendipita sp. 397]KAG8796749.1 hypothetical protein FRC16_009509 [Serendipita sp. 398]KAG8831233.1 hypothetical protein FRC18_006931 [Serendipita sp. 400]KAG8865090.1 hypothetical protein FRC20_009886 [Serendipita sp. 405]